MTARIRFRDALRAYVPTWLADRPGKTAGFRLLWSMVAPLDNAADVMLQSLTAAWPGVGPATALMQIARTRGLLRWQGESNEDFATRLRGWLDTWRDAGSARAIARQLHGYLSSKPRVRIFSRSGVVFTIDTDGTESLDDLGAAFPWDNVSHPHRSGYWSELFIVVYHAWPFAGTWGDGETWDAADDGFGHDVSREEYDAITGLIAQWKAAHTYVRAGAWTDDLTLFDPDDPSSMPNGEWGQWSSNGAPSDRNLSECRYWEFINGEDGVS